MSEGNLSQNWKGFLCSVCGKASVSPDELHCLEHYPCLPEKFNDSISGYIIRLRNRIEELETAHANCIQRSSLPELSGCWSAPFERHDWGVADSNGVWVDDDDFFVEVLNAVYLDGRK